MEYQEGQNDNISPDRREVILARLLMESFLRDVMRKQAGCSFGIMSYNILYPHETKWGKDYRWPPRALALIALIRRHTADLIGLQEVAEIQLAQLETALPDYRTIIPRDEGHHKHTPFITNAIFYRSNRLRLLRSGWRRLAAAPAETDTTSGPPMLDHAPEWSDRHMVWAVFNDRRNGHAFFYINTHWPPSRHKQTHPGCAAEMLQIMENLFSLLLRAVVSLRPQIRTVTVAIATAIPFASCLVCP